MKKRLTDAEKWDDPWFRKLTTESKLFWIYLLDKCDISGVWKVDFDHAEFYLGYKIDKDRVFIEYGNRIDTLSEEYWWIPKFIAFQYGDLSKDSRPHVAVIRGLERFGILEKAKNKGYLKGMDTLKDKDKDKDKDKYKDITSKESNESAKEAPFKSKYKTYAELKALGLV